MSARNAYSPRLEIFICEYLSGIARNCQPHLIVVHVTVARI